MVVFGGLVVLTKGSALVPFIYTSSEPCAFSASPPFITTERAAQEDLFTRKKHDPSFPHHAIGYCLDAVGSKLGQACQ